MEEFAAIMAAGKIPLLDVESLQAVQQFRRAGAECLSVFLRPPSTEAYAARVRSWLSETDRSVSRYIIAARRQARAVARSGIYDFALENRKLNGAVEGALSWARALRPDLFKDVSTGASSGSRCCAMGCRVVHMQRI